MTAGGRLLQDRLQPPVDGLEMLSAKAWRKGASCSLLAPEGDGPRQRAGHTT